MNKQVRLIVHLVSGPVVVDIEPEKQGFTANWLLQIMESNGMAVFDSADGVVNGVLRGKEILGFVFEPQIDTEVLDLHKRRLVAEVAHMEQSLKKLNEGNEWKDGGDGGW